MKTSLLLIVSVVGLNAMANASVVDDMLDKYRSEGASSFSAERGKQRWFEEHPDPKKPGKTRNCTSCHTRNFAGKGRHVRTGKEIEPIAPSANSKRLTDPKFIEKWFKRNCKWVLGRPCTPQEKGDFLMFLRNQ